MYNRYVRNDDGVYTRVPVRTPPPEPTVHAGEPQRESPPPPPQGEGKKRGFPLPDSKFFDRILSKLDLKDVDTGDLILLLLLFLLFEEKADEELLIALGLLLIL